MQKNVLFYGNNLRLTTTLFVSILTNNFVVKDFY
jgi:hypothetical protein